MKVHLQPDQRGHRVYMVSMCGADPGLNLEA